MCEERLTQVAVSERLAREDAEATRTALSMVWISRPTCVVCMHVYFNVLL